MGSLGKTVMAQTFSSPPHFFNAEGGEDAVEEVFWGGFAGDFAEGLEGGNFLG